MLCIIPCLLWIKNQYSHLQHPFHKRNLTYSLVKPVVVKFTFTNIWTKNWVSILSEKEELFQKGNRIILSSPDQWQPSQFVLIRLKSFKRTGKIIFLRTFGNSLKCSQQITTLKGLKSIRNTPPMFREVAGTILLLSVNNTWSYQ